MINSLKPKIKDFFFLKKNKPIQKQHIYLGALDMIDKLFTIFFF